MAKVIYLLDAPIYFFRAYFSMPDGLSNEQGQPINGFYGFALLLADLLGNYSAEYMLVAFDESLGQCFRNDIYPEYKANRPPADKNIKYQLNACRDLCDAFGVCQLASSYYEADDLIGSAAKQLRRSSGTMVYVTADKDLRQLLKKNDRIWNYGKEQSFAVDDYLNEYGFDPKFMADYLALLGDRIDNIPGVPGIGEKTAKALVGHFGGLESIYKRLHELDGLPIRGKERIRNSLQQYRQQAIEMRKLTRINCDIDEPIKLSRIKVNGLDLDQFDLFCRRYKIGGRLQKAIKNKLRKL